MQTSSSAHGSALQWLHLSTCVCVLRLTILVIFVSAAVVLSFQVEEFQEKLTAFDDFSRQFKKLDEKAMQNLDLALEVAIPKLMAQMPTYKRDGDDDQPTMDGDNPFGEDLGGGSSEIVGGADWVRGWTLLRRVVVCLFVG